MDSRGVKRGHCRDCGENECKVYERPLTDENLCLYCKCPPTKHLNLGVPVAKDGKESVPFVKRNEEQEICAVVPVQNCSEKHTEKLVISDYMLKDSTNLTLNKQIEEKAKLSGPENHAVKLMLPGVIEDANSSTLSKSEGKAEITHLLSDSKQKISYAERLAFKLDPPLPTFSRLTMEELSQSNSLMKHSWDRVIEECASFYITMPSVSTHDMYLAIGSAMYRKYPCISKFGTTPWREFTKALSQKMRHFRLVSEKFQKKGFAPATKRKATVLEPADSEGQKIEKRKSRCQVKKPDHAHVLDNNTLLELQKKLAIEMDKPAPVSAIVKSILRETFDFRTSTLNQSQRNLLSTFLKEWPVLQKPEYILYEMSIMLGKEEMKEFSRKCKKMMACILALSTSAPLSKMKEDELMISAWLDIERSTGISKGKQKCSPVVKVVKDTETFKVAQVSEAGTCPYAVVLMKNGQLKQMNICGDTMIIKFDLASNFAYLITTLISLYYVSDIHYPPPYIQTMGLLSKWVLDHDCYQLSVKAHDVDKKISNVWNKKELNAFQFCVY